MRQLNHNFTVAGYICLLALSVGPVRIAQAADADLTIGASEHAKRLTLKLDSEFVSVTSKISSLQSSGLRFGARFALDPQWAAEINVGQAMDLASMSALYTNFKFHIARSLFGSFYAPESFLTVDGKEFLRRQANRAPNLYLSVGLEQYFFNASMGVYSGSGLGAELNYVFAWLGLDVTVGGKASFLVSGADRLTALGGLLGVGWSF